MDKFSLHVPKLYVFQKKLVRLPFDFSRMSVMNSKCVIPLSEAVIRNLKLHIKSAFLWFKVPILDKHKKIENKFDCNTKRRYTKLHLGSEINILTKPR